MENCTKIFARLKQIVEKTPEKIAILNSHGRNLSYRQLLIAVERLSDYFLSTSLHSIFIKKRPRVGLYLNDGLDNVIVVLALNAIGVEIVTINPKLKPSQVDSFVKFTAADCVFTDTVGLSTLSDLSVKTEDITCQIQTQVLAAEKDWSKAGDWTLVRPYGDRDPFIITLSSGSTGDPKPVIVSESNKIDRTNQAAQLYSINSVDRILNASPFFHSLGQRLTFVPILLGATLVLLEKFSVSRWIKTVERFDVTFTIAVSSHLHALEEFLCSGEQIGRLRGLVSSSAGISLEAKRNLFKQTKFDFFEMYGATEVATATNQDRILAENSIESVGKACPGVNISILDKNLVECPVGKVGEICIKSDLASPGYLNSREKNEESFYRGFFRTGDLGFLDENMFLHLRGRSNDLIISGGLNIYPQDIENVLTKHGAVVEVEVVGEPNEFLGEVIVAIVSTLAQAENLESELRELSRLSLASYQQPVRYIFMKSLPNLANGKRDKLAIKNMVRANMLKN